MAKGKGGRPSKFKPEFTEQVRKLCQLGATDANLADFFGVTVQTVGNWKKEHSEFFAALKGGKLETDTTVAASLLERALGAEWEEEHAFKLKRVTYGENGKRLLEEERVEVVSLTKRAPPDTTAMIFWLKNRQADSWRDKQAVEHSGTEGGPIEVIVTRKVVQAPVNRIAPFVSNGNGNGAHSSS